MSAGANSAPSIFERHNDAWNAGDWEALRALYHPDAVMSGPPEWPENAERVGWDEIRKQYERLRDPWAFDSTVISELEVRERRSLGRFRWRMRGKDSEIELEQEFSFSLRSRDGRIIEIRYSVDHETARAHFEA